MQYFLVENTGKGFITHEDNEKSQISGYPGNIWATENNIEWATRVNAIEKTKVEAQSIIDAEINGLIYAETDLNGYQNPLAGQQVVIFLP
jgi:ribonuclease HI